MIIGILNSKGGVGKSTLATHIAAHLARQPDQRTLLIDADPQETSACWAAFRRDTDLPTPKTVRLRNNDVYDRGRVLAKDFDNVVIDAGGAAGSGLRNALLIADCVLVPMGIGGPDELALDSFLTMVDTARIKNRTLKLAVVPNRIHPNSHDDPLRKAMAARGVKVMPQSIRERRAYEIAMTEMRTVEEGRPRVAAATYEMRCLYDQILAWAHGRPTRGAEEAV